MREPVKTWGEPEKNLKRTWREPEENLKITWREPGENLERTWREPGVILERTLSESWEKFWKMETGSNIGGNGICKLWNPINIFWLLNFFFLIKFKTQRWACTIWKKYLEDKLFFDYISFRTHQTYFKEIILRLKYISLRTHQTFFKEIEFLPLILIFVSHKLRNPLS